MKNLLLTVAILATAAASAADAETVTRYDTAFPFRATAAAPAGTAAWTAELYRTPAGVDATAVAGPLAAISRAEVGRWHRIGARVYAELPAAGARTNAAVAFLTGFDGIVAAPSDDLAEGLKDVAALSRMNVLARKVKELKSPDKVWLEGRMGLFQLDRVNPAHDDADVYRLEAYARIRRLAAFAKEPDGIAFDLNLKPRPEIRRREIKTRRRGAPSKKEIDEAFMDRQYLDAWNDAYWTYRIPYSRSDGEKHIGYPDPGIETFCWREFRSEKVFQERCFETLNRKYGEMVAAIRFDPKSENAKDKKPKALDLDDGEKREIYRRLPDLANVREEAARLRVAYYLDRLQGRPVPVLPPPVVKKKVELKVDLDEDAELSVD